MNQHPLVQRAEYFFTTLKPVEKIALLYDTDPDGITSAKIITEALAKFGLQIKLNLTLRNKEHSISDDLIHTMIQNKITILIVTDKAVDSDPKQIKKVEKFARICILDHHFVENDINSERTILFKPQLIGSSIPAAHYCSAKLSYDLLNQVIDISKLDWVAAIGIIGDMASSAWPEFLQQVRQKYSINGIHQQTQLETISNLIFFAEALDEAQNCFEILLQSKNPSDAARRLDKYKTVQQEVDYYINNLDQLVEQYQDHKLIILNINTKTKIKSVVSNIIAMQYRNHTILVSQQIGPKIAISARRNDAKENMNLLLQSAITGLEGNAGGHIPAAGASITIEDFPLFKSRIIKACKPR